MPTQAQILETQANYNFSTTPSNINGDKMGDMLARRGGVLVAQYNFATLGGAIGAVNLLDVDGTPAKLPQNAVIMHSFIDVLTAPTSGGSATISLGANTGVDLKALTAIASYTGIVACIPVGTAATAIKVTADRNITATIAVAALTAGKFNLLIQYVYSV